MFHSHGRLQKSPVTKRTITSTRLKVSPSCHESLWKCSRSKTAAETGLSLQHPSLWQRSPQSSLCSSHKTVRSIRVELSKVETKGNLINDGHWQCMETSKIIEHKIFMSMGCWGLHQQYISNVIPSSIVCCQFSTFVINPQISVKN